LTPKGLDIDPLPRGTTLLPEALLGVARIAIRRSLANIARGVGETTISE
jgi:hypothetical protein